MNAGIFLVIAFIEDCIEQWERSQQAQPAETGKYDGQKAIDVCPVHVSSLAGDEQRDFDVWTNLRGKPR